MRCKVLLNAALCYTLLYTVYAAIRCYTLLYSAIRCYTLLSVAIR